MTSVLPSFTYDPREHELEDGTTIDPGDDPLHLAMAVACGVAMVKGTYLFGINTASLWTGMLATFPWADVETDETAVSDAVLKLATVHEDGRLTVSYAGTPWEERLIAVAEEDHRDDPRPGQLSVDYGFGGNSDMELHTLARAVFENARLWLAEHPTREDV